MPEEHKFVTDYMLGSLTKWLRLAGFDTIYLKPARYSDLIGLAKSEERTILSRNTRLFEVKEITGGAVSAILIKDDDLARQIDQVLRALGITVEEKEAWRRCPEDNERLEPTGKETTRPFVPRYVYQTQKSFDRCPACNRFYWRGTHFRAISRKLDRAFKEAS